MLDLMKAPMKSRLRLISLAVTLVAVLPLRCLAQTQEVTHSIVCQCM